MAIINTVEQFDEVLEGGAFTSLGGYPLFFITHDGEALSYASAKANRELIVAEIAEGTNCGWRVTGFAINWEDGNLFCCDTNQRIPSAYGDDE